MNETIWILSAFLFVSYGDNRPLENKEFSTIEECIAHAEKLVEKHKGEGEVTASCTPKQNKS